MAPIVKNQKANTNTINKNTLVPLGICFAIVYGAWQVSWCAAQMTEKIDSNLTKIERNETELRKLSDSIQYIEKAMMRIEIKLGTFPKEEGNKFEKFAAHEKLAYNDEIN